LLQDRDIIATKRPTDQGPNYTLTNNDNNNIIYSNITDAIINNNSKTDNTHNVKNIDPSFYFNQYELVDTKKNIEIFQYDVNMESIHIKAKEWEQEGMDIKESIKRGAKFSSGTCFRHGQVHLNSEVLEISKAWLKKKLDLTWNSTI